MTDAFDQLRVTDDRAAPDPRFTAGLRNRIAAALEAAGLPTVTLPDRSPAMTDTATTPATPAADAPATSTIVPYLARPTPPRRSTGTSPCSARSSGCGTPATTAASATPS